MRRLVSHENARNSAIFRQMNSNSFTLSLGRGNTVGFIGLFLTLWGVLGIGGAHGVELVVIRGDQPTVAVAAAQTQNSGLPSTVLAQELEITSADGIVSRLRFDSGRFTSFQVPSPIAEQTVRPDSLPDGEVTGGANNIFEAWLTQPTDRYGHGILGDTIEAGALAVLGEDGRISQHVLDRQWVFEDRKARIADLDGDGLDEVIVVRTNVNLGAALAVFGLGRNGLELLAETPPIGTARRWLNPVGVGDFDGDGVTEIAFVTTPHIGGFLTLYEYRSSQLVFDYVDSGYSNHAIGTREQDLSTVLDWNGDGVMDLALPSADRQTMRIVSFAGGTFAELASSILPARLVGTVTATDLDRDGTGELAFIVEDGTLIWLRP